MDGKILMPPYRSLEGVWKVSGCIHGIYKCLEGAYGVHYMLIILRFLLKAWAR